MDLVARLKLYIEHLGLQISQFADAAQIPRPTLSQILTGRNKKISNELLEKLHNAYPRLNVAWLLFGDGDMEINGLPKIVSQALQPKDVTAIEQSPIVQLDTAQNSHKNSASTPLSGAPDGVDDEKNKANVDPFANKISAAAQQSVAFSPDTTKHIQSIMVFYSDNSFEIFKPSQR